MFLNDTVWQDVAEPAARLQTLTAAAAKHTDRILLEWLASHGQPRAARHRQLSFYRDFELVELEMSPGDFDLDSQRAFLYCLAGPRGTRVLNGESRVIHEVNGRGRAAGTESALVLQTDQQALDYLEFFCTFVTGDYGPFLIVDGRADLAWRSAGNPDDTISESFDVFVAQKRAALRRVTEIRLDERDLDAWAASSDGDARRLFGDRAGTRAAPGPQARTFDAIVRDLHEPAIERQTLAEGKEAPAGWKATATVWYAGLLFDAQFVVKPDGDVEMSEDNPRGYVPHARWEMAKGLPLLVRGHPKRRQPAELIRRDLLAATSPRRVTNVRVTGDVDLRGLSFAGEVEFEDVEIEGDLVLEGTSVEQQLNLRSVWVSGRVRADDLRCGRLDAPSLRAIGLSDASPQLAAESVRRPVLSLRGATVAGSVNLQGAEIHGPMDFSNIRCGGPLILSGVQCASDDPIPYFASPTPQPLPGCDLSGGQFDGDVRISAVSAVPGGGGRRTAEIAGGLRIARALVGGSLDVSGLRISPRRLQGMVLATQSKHLRTLAEQKWPGRWHMVYVHETERVDIVVPYEGDGDLVLEGTIIRGHASFRDIEAGGIVADRLDVGQTFSLEGRQPKNRAHMTGHVSLIDAKVTRHLRAVGVNVDGNFDLTGGSIGGDLTLVGATIGGTMDLTRLKAGSVGFTFDRNWGRVIFRGEVTAYALDTAYITMGGAHVGKGLHLVQARIQGLLDADSHEEQRTEIEGDVILSGATVGSDTRFSAARIGGTVMAITGSFDRVQLRALITEKAPASEDKPREYQMQAPEIGGLMFDSTTFKSLDLYACTVHKRVEVKSAHVKGDVSFFKAVPATYLLSGAEDPKARESCVRPAASVSASLGEGLKMRHVKIDGDLDLTNVRSLGSATFEQIEITGDLLAPRHPIEQPGIECTTRFESFRCDKSTVTRDVRLDGLELGGALSVEASEIKGELHLSNSILGGLGPNPAAGAQRVNLADLTARKVMLLGGLRPCPLIDLARAKVDYLDIRRELPAEINLSDARVQTWIVDPSLATEKAQAEELREVLHRTRPFDRALYSGAERWLSQRGDDRAAHEVHVDMRWRALRDADKLKWSGRRPGWVRRMAMAIAPWHLFWERGRSKLIGVYTAFWTKGARVLLPVAVFAVLTLLAVSARENIAPTDHTRPRTEMPTAQSWTPWTALEVFIMNHVPFLPAVSSPRWEFAVDRPLVLRLPWWHERLPPALIGPAIDTPPTRHGWVVTWLSPEAYGLIVRLLSWIAWPFFLIGVTANIQRRRGLS